MGRISKIDLVQLNQQFRKLGELENQFRQLQNDHDLTRQQLLAVQLQNTATNNNLIFTWTGSTLTLSWATGSLRYKTTSAIPIAAGSIANLLASSYYWLAWNKVHSQMAADVDVTKLASNPTNILICQVFTGTAGQTGVAGGGGSNNATELSGVKYKNF